MPATLNSPARPRDPRNGVETPKLFATLDVVKGQPELARFQFRASNRWMAGTHSRSRIERFYGAGGEQQHRQAFEFDGDHPNVLVGQDHGPTPVESLLHALAACLTAGIANIAAARGIDLHEVESSVEGDIDLQGIFGFSKEVRNGYEGIRVNFKIRGDAPAEKLRDLIAQSQARSAVYDVLTNGTRVAISVDAA
jgi:uncharacterized OsmC-like protein